TACDLPADADGYSAVNGEQDVFFTQNTAYEITMSPDPHGFSVTGVAPGNYAASQLAPQVYTFTVLADNGCQASTAFEVPDQPAVPLMEPLTIANQLICDPDGSVTVNDIKVNNTVVPHASFDFTWYKDDVTNAPIIPATTGENVLDVTNYPAMEAGSYFVVAQRIAGQPGAGCESVPVRAEIE